MKALYLRVWLTVVVMLALFAGVSGWLFQRQVEQQRVHFERQGAERAAAWGELVQRSLPPADAPTDEQAAGLIDWAERLRVPMALDDAQGRRVATSPFFARLEAASAGMPPPRRLSVPFEDGRTLHLLRPGPRASMGPPTGPMHRHDQRPGGPPPGTGPGEPPGFGFVPTPPGWPRGVGVVLVLGLLFMAVALGAYPVVRRLTRRLEALQRGVEQFGAGALDRRVDATGRDEVAAVAASFNRAAERIEALVQANQSLLANASHELRSPLARLKMAVSMLDEAEPAGRAALLREVHTNIAELDQLVEEVLLASRLEAQAGALSRDTVDLHALAVEEAAVAAPAADVAAPEPDAASCQVIGDERLLRRALRNLLENAHRYGDGADRVTLQARAGRVVLTVCDRGPGVPEAMRERIFEPFFRLPGHAEREGGVGLGLSLVRQIARRHGGQVRCEPREGGGSCFRLDLPAPGGGAAPATS